MMERYSLHSDISVGFISYLLTSQDVCMWSRKGSTSYLRTLQRTSRYGHFVISRSGLYRKGFGLIVNHELQSTTPSSSTSERNTHLSIVPSLENVSKLRQLKRSV